MTKPQLDSSSLRPIDEQAAPSSAVISKRLNDWLSTLGLLLIIAVFCTFVWAHFFPAIYEPDDNGYFAQGTLLSQTGKSYFFPQSDAQYIGIHWLLTNDGYYISRYPPGIAIAVAGIDQLIGYRAAVLFNPLMGILTLVGLFLVVKDWMNLFWALAATALLLINPTFTHHALSGDSHMTVAALLVWGIYFLLKWSQDWKLRQIFLAGLIFGCVPSIRYPDAIVALGVAAFVFWNAPRIPNFRRHFITACIGAGIPIGLLLVRNQLVLGAFWKTGYALTNEQSGFSLRYFAQHFVPYIRSLTSDGLGLIFGLGLIGMMWMVAMKSTRAMGLMLALISVPMLCLYMDYYFPPSGMTAGAMRFLLPTFPLYILAAVWALRQATQTAPAAIRIGAPLLLIALQIAAQTQEIMQFAADQRYQKEVLASVTNELQRVAPKGSVVIAPQHFLQHLDFVREWKLADDSLVTGRGPGGMPRPMGSRAGPGMGPDSDMEADAPSPMQQAKLQLQRQHYKGSADEKEQQFLKDLLKWTPEKHVYVISSESQLSQGIASMAHGSDLKIVARVKLPQAPPMNERQQGRRPMGGRPGMGGPPGMMGRPPGMMGGPGGFRGGPGNGAGPMAGGPGGGLFGMGSMAGEKEVVIAAWTVR